MLGGGSVLHSSKEQFETKEMTVRVVPVNGGYVGGDAVSAA